MKELYDLLPDIDFSTHSIIYSIDKELEQNPKLKDSLRQAYNERREEIKKAADLPAPTMDLGEYVIVTNLPIIPKEKEAKFLEVFLTITEKLGLKINKDEITMPFKADGKENYGMIFIRCADLKTADSVSTKLYNVKIGKNSIKSVIMADYDKVISNPPLEKQSSSKVDLHKWMLEPIAQQYGMSIGKEVKVWWHTDPARKVDEPVEIKTNGPITGSNFKWSPMGTYLVTKDADVN